MTDDTHAPQTVATPAASEENVAYFSMEIGLDASIPTYSGGLGVLAGDTLRAAADLGASITAVTLIYHNGYVRQHLDESGSQSESPFSWDPRELLEPLDARTTIRLEGREVVIRPWRYVVEGQFGDEVPVIFLDTNLEDNDPYDRTLTDHLYGGDLRYRLCQEAVLGIGGVKILDALDINSCSVYHMNEGHSALLTMALLRRVVECRDADGATEEEMEIVRSQCVFTTHTPVPAGHDKFDWDLVRRVLPDDVCAFLEECDCSHEGMLNMTYLALRFSRYINGVAMRHEDISKGMFPGYPIHSITNGVHAPRWICDTFLQLFDEHVPNWRRDKQNLRYATGIPLDDIRAAHTQMRHRLIEEVNRRTGRDFKPDAFTIGFARRATAYKRADMLFSDLDRLRYISRHVGPIQAVFAGEAHPKDESGKQMIRDIFDAAEQLRDDMPVVWLEGYDIDLANLVIAGSDIWLNTPLKPHEASGTSGMKAALNGVPSFSVLDGWWLEGHIEGVTGWSIGDESRTSDELMEIQDMYSKLERIIVPMFYENPDEFARIRRSCIALNGSFFNAQRMVEQYLRAAYFSARQDGNQQE
ncbi:MAG: alpha-glucan family phosphorylase [Armatimonadota bacterium]